MNYLEKILPEVRRTIESGYYKHNERERKSLVEAIENAKHEKKTPIIAELKPASPSKGAISNADMANIGKEYVEHGATALSVLTEPTQFKGNLKLLQREWEVPVLMKDFVIDERQIGSGDAVLLILKLLDMAGKDPAELIDKAHENDIEALLEVHSTEEFLRAKKTEADIIGINNRNLENFDVDIRNTCKILAEVGSDRVVISESGIQSRKDVEQVLGCGADAALIGTSLLKSESPGKMLSELL